MIQLLKTFTLVSIIFVFFPVRGQENNTISKEAENIRTTAYTKQLENYLNEYLVNQYDKRAAKAWNRDYSSLAAFERSVAVNRNTWKAILNPPVLQKTGPLKTKPHPYLSSINAE